MEQWKQSILIGATLIILALLFSFVRGEINIWIGLVVVLGVVNIIVGILRKRKEGI